MIMPKISKSIEHSDFLLKLFLSLFLCSIGMDVKLFQGKEILGFDLLYVLA